MQVINSQNFEDYNIENVAVAIGSFDGIHIGHQKIINKTIEIAKNNNMNSGVYSFIPHPMKVVAPEKAPSFLLSRKQKIKILENMNIDYFFEQNFTEEFSKLSFRKFVSDILLKKLNIKNIIIGEDFRFGNNQTGDTNKLEELEKKFDINVWIMSVLKEKDEKISSTFIRNLIKKGKIKKAAEYLGRNYTIEGKVVKGEGRGRKFGIPTANLELATNYVLPPKGVYSCFAYYNNKKYKAVVNFGQKPTFDKNNFTIEVHLLNCNKNMYGKTLEIELIEFIRKEKSFSNQKKLIDQIKSDILYTRNHLC